MLIHQGLLLAILASTFATFTLARQSHFSLPRSSSSHLTKRHHVQLSPRSKKPSCVVNRAEQVTNETVDYIVIGGGTAGLVMASRLSEDPSVKVLVIEAGPSGYRDDASILVPNGAYYHSALNTKYDWNYTTTAQVGLDGRSTPLPRGRTLGGSSAVNGLYYVRHGRRDAAAFSSIANGMLPSGKAGWDWNSVHSAMNDSVQFSSETDLPFIAQAVEPVKESLEGGKGPVKIGYPRTSFAIQGAWLPAFAELGVPQAKSSFKGNNNGAFIAPTTIDTKLWQRSFSRTAYVDSLARSRDNLKILTGHTVTRILFADKSKTSSQSKAQARAEGVECASSKAGKRYQFNARREVILAAGAIGSPQILQLSGIGDSKLLKKLEIPVVKDLPGVGYHLQDHVATSVSYPAKRGVELQNASTTTYTDSAIAYLGLEDLLGSAEEVNEFLRRNQKATQSYIDSTTSDVPASVKAGWNRTMTMLLSDLLVPNSPSGFKGASKGAMEILLSTLNGQIGLEQALQAPFSRGSVKIASSDAFQSPQIDTAYLTHPADLELLLAGHTFSRRLATSKAFKPFLQMDNSTSAQLSSSQNQVKSWIRRNAATEYHLSSTCSMLPEAEGGVVGSDLKVFGTSNVRVIDASVIPISPTTHLVSYVYGLAEIGAKMVRGDSVGKNGRVRLQQTPKEEEEKGDEEEDCDEGEEEDNKTTVQLNHNGNGGISFSQPSLQGDAVHSRHGQNVRMALKPVVTPPSTKQQEESSEPCSCDQGSSKQEESDQVFSTNSRQPDDNGKDDQTTALEGKGSVESNQGLSTEPRINQNSSVDPSLPGDLTLSSNGNGNGNINGKASLTSPASSTNEATLTNSHNQNAGSLNLQLPSLPLLLSPPNLIPSSGQS